MYQDQDDQLTQNLDAKSKLTIKIGDPVPIANKNSFKQTFENHVGKLNEICSARMVPGPDYSICVTANGEYIMKCKMFDNTVTQGQSKYKNNAKHAAAESMLRILTDREKSMSQKPIKFRDSAKNVSDVSAKLCPPEDQFQNYVGKLNEFCSSNHWKYPSYQVCPTDNGDFSIKCKMFDKTVTCGRSKLQKHAKQKAAEAMLEVLHNREHSDVEEFENDVSAVSNAMVNSLTEPFQNYVGKLNEIYFIIHKKYPSYKVCGTKDCDYIIECKISDNIITRGQSKNKKDAKQKSAKAMLNLLSGREESRNNEKAIKNDEEETRSDIRESRNDGTELRNGEESRNDIEVAGNFGEELFRNYGEDFRCEQQFFLFKKKNNIEVLIGRDELRNGGEELRNCGEESRNDLEEVKSYEELFRNGREDFRCEQQLLLLKKKNNIEEVRISKEESRNGEVLRNCGDEFKKKQQFLLPNIKNNIEESKNDIEEWRNDEELLKNSAENFRCQQQFLLLMKKNNDIKESRTGEVESLYDIEESENDGEEFFLNDTDDFRCQQRFDLVKYAKKFSKLNHPDNQVENHVEKLAKIHYKTYQDYPWYRVCGSENGEFIIECKIFDNIVTRGQSKYEKDAKQKAAEAMLKVLVKSEKMKKQKCKELLQALNLNEGQRDSLVEVDTNAIAKRNDISTVLPNKNVSLITRSCRSLNFIPNMQFTNYVGKLNEVCFKANRKHPIYTICKHLDKNINREFIVNCEMSDKTSTQGRSRSSKKDAKQKSAAAMLEMLSKNYEQSNGPKHTKSSEIEKLLEFQVPQSGMQSASSDENANLSESLIGLAENYVGKLIEICIKESIEVPTYIEYQTENKEFISKCKTIITSDDIVTLGRSIHKKDAKQKAAQAMIHILTQNFKTESQNLMKSVTIIDTTGYSQQNPLEESEKPTIVQQDGQSSVATMNKNQLEAELRKLNVIYRVSPVKRTTNTLALKTKRTKNYKSFTFIEVGVNYDKIILGLLRRAVIGLRILKE